MTQGLTNVVSEFEAESSESVDAVCACMLCECRLGCGLGCGLGCRWSALPTTALRAPSSGRCEASVVWVTRLAFCDCAARVFVLIRGAVAPLRTDFLVLMASDYIGIYIGLPPIWFGEDIVFWWWRFRC